MSARHTHIPLRRLVQITIAGCCLLAAACSPGPIGDADGELVLGVLLPLTGPQAEEGAEAKAAVEGRMAEVGAAAEFDRLQIRVVFADVRSDDALIPSALEEFAANNVDVVIGPPSVTQNRLTTSIVAGSNTVTQLPLTQSIHDQMTMLADAIRFDGHSLVTLLAPKTSAEDLGKVLDARLFENGGQLLSTVPFDPSAERFDPEAALVADDESTAVLIVGADDPQRLIDGIEAAGAGAGSRTVYVVGGTSSVTPGLGIRLVQPLAPLADRVTDRLVIAALAAAKAETDDPSTIASSIDEVVGGTALCSSFSNCLSTLRNGETVRFAGAANNAFDGEGNPVEVPYQLRAFDADGGPNETDSRIITSG